MSQVVVLTADPARARAGRSPLDPSIAAAVRAVLAAGGSAAAEVDWLAAGIACDIPIGVADPDRAAAAARAALGDAPVDANVVANSGRRKRLLVADMESTLIENEMLDDLAAMAGIGAKVAGITRRAMNGELEFGEALRERVALLAGLPARRVDEAARAIRLVPGAAILAHTMKAHGAFTAIVSGGFRCFTGRVRERLGFDWDEGNDLEIAAGALTGGVREPVLARDAKAAALHRLAAERGIPLRDCLAVGDGANDLPMLEAAGLGVAFRPKPAVAAAARLRIAHRDLTALLYLQGYRQGELVD